MANLVPINLPPLPPLLERQREHLINHYAYPVQEYYSGQAQADKVKTIYVNAVRSNAGKAAGCGALIGAAISWALGCKRKEMIENAFLGAGGGVLADSIYRFYQVRVQIREDDSYLEWKNAVQKPVLDDFKRVIDREERFENFFCIITQYFPKIPVRDSFGRLYDQEEIFNWIDEKGTNPITRERMTRDDVVFCPNFAPDLKDLMEEVFGSDKFMEFMHQEDDQVFNGIKALLRSSIINHNAIVFATAKTEMDEAIAQGLSPVEANERYQQNIKSLMREVPTAPKVSGFTALVTAESVDNVKNLLLNDLPKAITEVGPALLPSSAIRQLSQI